MTEAAAAGGQALPGTHSPRYAPDAKVALPAGAAALATCALELFAAP